MTALRAMLESPLFGIALTLGVYLGAVRLWRRCGQHPLLTPVLVTIVIISSVLSGSDVSYETYKSGGDYIHFLLGPATVALAIPLYRSAAAIRRFLVPIAAGVLAGSVAAIMTSLLVVAVWGGGHELAATLAPKSATTPIALAVAVSTGGIGPLAAVITVVTGVLGAVAGPGLLSLARIRDQRLRGLAMGVSAHGVGTSRALQESEQAGAFSALAMALTGVMTAVLVPLVFALR